MNKNPISVDENKTNELLGDILNELKGISEYINFLKWEEMCKREINKNLPTDDLNPIEKGMFIDSRF